ncbi:g7626 [Coccomyxa viridis]|uniref:G7626 protein n=1 Tax=Coccomyxa viridis TaxID=1274662 RepID=A0ABP1FYE7_9CHLO
MRRDTGGLVKGWATGSTGWAGHTDSGRLLQSRQQDSRNSLGVSWLLDLGFTGGEQGPRKPQRRSTRPGTPRPGIVEPLQSQAMAEGPGKENCSLEGGQPRQTSKRQALRRLQQRAALQGLNGQSTPHADPLHNAPGPFPTHTDPSNGILGHSEPSTGLQSSPLLSLGAELGFPGRPVFEGGTPSEIVSAGLLQPGQQALGGSGSKQPVIPRLDFSRVSSTDAAAEDSERVPEVTFCESLSRRTISQLRPFLLPGILDGASSGYTEQDVPFDISIGLPLPGSPDSWEPFNPTFLGLGAPGFVRSPDPAQSPDLWASQDRQLLPPYYLMSSGSSGVLHASSAVDVSSDVHHDIKAHAAAQCTVTACCRASAGEAVVYTLDSCRLHGSSVGSMEDPLSQTPGPGRQMGAGAGPGSNDDHVDVHPDGESIEYCLEVSPTSEISPQSQSSSPMAATPVRAGPSPETMNRADWSPFMSHLLEDTVKGLFQSPFKRGAKA